MPWRGWRPGIAIFGLVCFCVGPARADEPSLEELRSLTIEQLANLEVTSVSRRGQSIAGAPAAIELITAEDIRRSGAQSLPEILRLARNLEVARVDSQRYAISARGFNTFQASNKLLVLIDGRSVYTPLYSGVFWDQQIVTLDDIDRIEVISGPGGTLWGANAVNGVINIVTRSAAATQGLLAHAWAGSLDSRVDLRYGGLFGDSGAYRVFATAFERGETLTEGGAGADDAWSAGQVGFRADWDFSDGAFMLQGQAYDRFDDEGDLEGGHLLGRWTRRLDNGSAFEAQAYFSQASASVPGVSDWLRTWDLDLQHSFRIEPGHQIVWGGGYRVSDSEFINTTNPSVLDPVQQTLHTTSLFVQDEIALTENLALIAGLKLEDHTYTDLEYMPNVRLAWRPSDNALLWAAISRAVRTPSRIDRELISPGVIVPGAMESEILLAYELGYRMQPTQDTTFSINLYYHDYEGVRTANLTPPGVLPVRLGNGLNGEVYGVEMWGEWAIRDNWRLGAGLTLLEQDLRAEPLALDINGSGDDPGYQFFLRSRADLTDRVGLDLDLRVIDEASPLIPAYAELGARLSWRITDNVELALIGDNLLDEAHPESFDEDALFQAQRSVHLSLRLSY